MDYSPDVPGPHFIKGINGNTNIKGIGTLKLSSPNGELILKGVLRAPGLPYSLLSLGKLLLDDITILFETYCIIENANGFYLKSKFSQSFGATSYLFRFRAEFPTANLANRLI
jgi:hypothetical protein